MRGQNFCLLEVGRYRCQNDGLDEADTMARREKWKGGQGGREGGREGGLTEAGHEEGVATGRVPVSMQESHQISKTEEHHGMHAEPGLVESGWCVAGGMFV